MQKGLTGIRPVMVLPPSPNPNPQDIRTVLIVNSSAVQIYLGDDEVSATAGIGVPIIAGGEKTFHWHNALYIGADADNTEYRYMISPHFAGAQETFESLRAKTPPPPEYFNRPAGR